MAFKQELAALRRSDVKFSRVGFSFMCVFTWFLFSLVVLNGREVSWRTQ